MVARIKLCCSFLILVWFVILPDAKFTIVVQQFRFIHHSFLAIADPVILSDEEFVFKCSLVHVQKFHVDLDFYLINVD